ncbi:MAG: hypothetical protein OEU26_10310 [Candidatus Tectomicrobia bacterium]|nr:hypothetical protein [Candidatus Tectomicrobia bacterium]
MMSSLPRSPLTRHISLALGAVLTACALFAVAVAYRSQQEFARAETAHQSGAYAEAITHYERAIKWYLPHSGSVRRAVASLWDMGVAAEARADTSLALAAYRALRGSLFAIQSLYVPYPEWIPKCEARIAALMPDTMQANYKARAPQEQHRVRFLRMFERNLAPQLGWSLLLELGFLAWVGATIGLIWDVDIRDGRWIWRHGWRWSSGIALGFAAWVIGMLYA